MKKILLFAALLVGISAQAQITVTNTVFPVAGDVMERSVTNNVGSASVTAASGTAQNWDFSFLTTDFLMTDSIVAASTGLAFADFPDSDVLTPLLGFGTAYTDVTATEVVNIGAGMEFFGMSFVAAYTNPQTLQTAPLTYPTTTNDDFSVAFAEHIDSIPFLRQLIDSINPLPGISPDSIRIRLTGISVMDIDAFGTCQMFDTTYNVLRQKTVLYTAIRIDMHAYIFGFPIWQDVTSYISGQLPIPLTDTTYRYDFIAEGEKTPIVRLNMDSEGTNVQNAQFKGNNPVGVSRRQMPLAAIQVFPNPTADVLNLRTENLGVDVFDLQIVDALGRTVLSKTNTQGTLHQISLTDLPQGNYFLLLRSELGQLLAEERVVVRR